MKGRKIAIIKIKKLRMNLNTGNNRENSMKAKAGSSEKSQRIAKSLYRLKMKKDTNCQYQ